LKRLVTKYGEAEVADAIRGLAFLRDTGKLKWARPRTKMTLRALAPPVPESAGPGARALGFALLGVELD
jgi:hypothetical protein